MKKHTTIFLLATLCSVMLANAQNLQRLQQQRESYNRDGIIEYDDGLFGLDFATDYTFPAGIGGSNGSELSTYSIGISGSAGPIYASYSFTDFDWKNPAGLPFGNNNDSPLEHIHLIDLGVAYGAELNEKLEYGIQVGANIAFEDDLGSDSTSLYFDAGLSYQINDDWSLSFGGGAEYNLGYGDLEAYPILGLSWRAEAEDGFSFSVGFPDTSLTYHLSPVDNLSLSLTYGGFYTQLADDTTVQNGRFMEASRYGIGLNYSTGLTDDFSLDVGVSYLLKGDISVLDKNGNEISEYDYDNGFRFNIGMSYSF